jgi:hypothetical protein
MELRSVDSMLLHCALRAADKTVCEGWSREFSPLTLDNRYLVGGVPMHENNAGNAKS